MAAFAQCIQGDCTNGNGTFKYRSGSKYVGQFKGGDRQGIGSLYYADGSKYQGQWLKDQPHGEGVETLPDGTTMEGVWRNGRLAKRVEKKAAVETVAKGSKKQTGCISGDCSSGKGIYIYPSGAVYIGEFQSGEIHGYGTCYYANGSKYKGNWAHRYPDGKGVKTFANGTTRDGYWKKGQPVDEFGNFDDVIENVVSASTAGDGTDIQSGCISGDCNDGQGVFAYPDGSRYEGRFTNGKPNQNGTFHYQNGDKYVGNFRLGQPNGNGRMFYHDGRTLTGVWENGEFLGKTNKKKSNGPGCIAGNCKHGYGTYLFEDGTKYEGRFLDGYPHGNGIVTYTNGEKYEGEMANGSFEGYGTLDLVNGTQVTGYWSNGKFVGNKKKNTAPLQSEAPSNSLPMQPDIQVWAVIIGVAAYDHMPALRYTDDDAYRMYAFFKSPEGGALDDEHIRILIDEDATRERIMNTMSEVFGKAGENDLIMLYFSGHGLKGSFLPIDFDGFNNKIYHEEINRILRNSKAKLKLCIADACHSGSLLAGRGDEIPETLQTFYKSLAQSGPGSALLMSSKSDETSLESKGLRQGVFSHFLIRGLKGEADSNKDDLVSIQELYNYIFFNVRAYTGKRQSPLIQGNYDKNMSIAIRRK